MNTLTVRQAQIVDFIRVFRAERSYSPTTDEMAKHFGIVRNAIHEQVVVLEKKGFLTTRPKTARSIVLTEDLALVSLIPRILTNLLVLRALVEGLIPKLSAEKAKQARREIAEVGALVDRIKKASRPAS